MISSLQTAVPPSGKTQPALSMDIFAAAFAFRRCFFEALRASFSSPAAMDSYISLISARLLCALPSRDIDRPRKKLILATRPRWTSSRMGLPQFASMIE